MAPPTNLPHLSRRALKIANSEVEQAWQNLRVLNHTGHSETRAMLFQQMLEDIHLANTLRKLSQNLQTPMIPMSGAERPKEWMVVSDAESLSTFWRTQVDSCHDRARSAQSLRKCLVAQDQIVTVSQAEELNVRQRRVADHKLQLIETSPLKRGVTVLKANAYKLYSAWVQLGKLIGLVTSTLILSALFYLFGVFVGRRAAQSMKGSP